MGGSALALDEKSRPRQGFCIDQFHQRLPFSDITNFHAIMYILKYIIAYDGFIC